LCEYVIANLDAILENKQNEEEIKAALESVCNIMPATVRYRHDYYSKISSWPP
jgi:saposin